MNMSNAASGRCAQAWIGMRTSGREKKSVGEDSTCFWFTSLQKQLWDNIGRMHFVKFFLLFPFSQHPSVPSYLLLLPRIAGSLAELLMGGMPSGHRELYPQIPWHSSKPQNSQEQHTSSEAVGCPAAVAPSPGQWNCTGHAWLTMASGLCYHCWINFMNLVSLF